jgi:hypothetical protein
MNESIHILEAVESGEMTVDEAVRRLTAATDQPEPETSHPAPPSWVRRLPAAVFWSGVAVTTGGGLLLTARYAWGAGPGSLICGWPSLAFGALLVTLGAWMQSAHWLTLRVQRRGRPNVALALPLPLGFVAWVLRTVRPVVPRLRDTAIDELILALGEELCDDHPIVVDVGENDGERIHISLC